MKWFQTYSDLHHLDQDLKSGNDFMRQKLEKQKLQLRIKALAKKEKAGTLTEQEYNELFEKRQELSEW